VRARLCSAAVKRLERAPDEGWARFGVRQVLLGVLGLPGDELIAGRGRLRWATIAFWVALAIVVVALLVALT
jgi:hypothetical protein